MAQFQAGDAVKVYETANVAAIAAHYDADPGTAATIEREMPNWQADGQPEPEYELDNGTIVPESRIRPA